MPFIQTDQHKYEHNKIIITLGPEARDKGRPPATFQPSILMQGTPLSTWASPNNATSEPQCPELVSQILRCRLPQQLLSRPPSRSSNQKHDCFLERLSLSILTAAFQKKNCIGLRYLYQSTLHNRFDITNCCQSTIHVQQSTMNINININTRIIKSKTTMGSNCNKKHQLQPKWLLEEVKVYFS